MLLKADARAIPLRDSCVQCCVTSPPYFGLRDYQTANQIGLEPTPPAYVTELVAVFREVWRVLRDDGTVWLNLGDSYNSSTQFNQHASGLGSANRYQESERGEWPGHRPLLSDLKPKDLLGIPWRVAFALQEHGWYLRSDIIWHKPNPMPESVTDRPTKAHEYLFLLAKSERYYYDAAAIAEIAVEGPDLGLLRGRDRGVDARVSWHAPSIAKRQQLGIDSRTAGNGFRNARSVWTINPEPYEGAHYATFPQALVERCILAGSRLNDLVLDPFGGTATVGVVAERLGRRWICSDLAYHDLAQVRTAQRGLQWPDAAKNLAVAESLRLQGELFAAERD